MCVCVCVCVCVLLSSFLLPGYNMSISTKLFFGQIKSFAILSYVLVCGSYKK